MSARTTINLITVALLCVTASLSAVGTAAEQKQQVLIKIPAENNKFGVQQNIVVGDLPSHIVRVFEVHYNITDTPPIINGLKLAEIWQRGITDAADGSGTASSYFLFVMENGDKFFVRNASIIQPAGAAGLSSTGIGHITRGTGKLEAIQGIARQATTFDPVAGRLGDIQIEIEYWMKK